MTSILKKLSVLVLVISFSTLAGCAATGVGGGGDSAALGDLLNERAVIRALYDEPSLTGKPILVGCVDGVITLSGEVDTDVERQLAARVAQGVEGVTSVNNNLSVIR